MGPTNGSSDCFSDAIYDGYALQHLADDERVDFERHLKECSSCAERVQQTREEAIALRDFLLAAPEHPGDDCTDEEALALYLDDALAPAQRSATEEHLSRCRSCQRSGERSLQLLHLYW